MQFSTLFIALVALFTALVSAAPTMELEVRHHHHHHHHHRHHRHHHRRGGDHHRCASARGGIHVIVAHGTTETGTGALTNLANSIAGRFPGSTIKALDYPAVYDPYQWSVDQGTSKLTKHIHRNIRRCPNNRIVLLGYSQGGQVVMNTLCGTTESGFSQSPPLAARYAPHIASVVVYADPSHLAGQSYDRGTGYSNGMFPRENPGGCSAYSGKIQAYCDSGDPYCDLGDDGAVHGEYFAKYDGQASTLAVSSVSANLAAQAQKL